MSFNWTSARYLFGVINIFFGAALMLLVSASSIGLVENYPEPPKNRIPKHYKEISDVESLYLVEGEKLSEYYSRLSVSLYRGIIPYWTETHSRVSIYDNFLLWGYSYLPGHTHFKEFEFALPQKAIDRGVGACSQLARLAYYILADQKIPSLVVSQSSHVVLELENGVLDAYHGVFIPFGVAHIAKNPDLLDEYYPRNSSDMRVIYSQKWDYPKNQVKTLNYMMRMELIAEIMKWIIPTLMILIGFLLVVKNWFYIGKHNSPP